MVKTINEALWLTSCAIASVQGQIDDMGVEVGESMLLDKVYSQLSMLESELDNFLESENFKND